MFCVIKNKEDIGICKLLQDNIETCIVAYFISPASSLKEIKISKNDINSIKLERNQRVFYNYDLGANKWKTGFILDHLYDQKKLYIQFPNKETIYLNIDDEVYVRSNLEIEDPTFLLANKITETPFFTSNRNKFLREYTHQRNVSKGMSAYLSSNIFLEEHQYNVVSKILSDPFQRYLLADEVGLGKTIEAGILIKQKILDNSISKILIITPKLLKKQWKEELSIRFNLNNDHNIQIIGYDQISKVKNDKFSMIVIDEAHNLVTNVDENYQTENFKIIQKLTKKVDSLLILSATPALGNEKSFLAMLNILDPVLYPLNSLEKFKLKISNRQNIASIVSQLSPETIFFIPEQLSNLKNQFEDDSRLIELSKNLIDIINTFPEEDDPELISSIEQLKSHISEVYKLDRRILRNRRKKYFDLTLDREGCEYLYYDDIDSQYVIDSLEEWRLASLKESSKSDIRAKELSEIFFLYLNAALTDIYQLEEYVDVRIGNLVTNNIEMLTKPKYFLDEIDFLRKIKKEIQIQKKSDIKINFVVEKIKEIQLKENILVFCSSDIICENLFNKLNKLFSEKVSIYNPNSKENIFINDSKKIFICNRNAEEGLNLQQTNASIIHYDIPINPNRIEQRIGRIDRYGSRKEAKSYLIINNKNNYELYWSKCLENGFGVFNNSIASLQYLVEDEMSNLKEKLLLEGFEFLDDFISYLSGTKDKNGKIQQEIKKIDISDSLNEMIFVDKKESFEVLEDSDNEKNSMKSFIPLITKSYRLDIQSDNVMNKIDNNLIFRFKYNYNKFQNNSLINFSDFKSLFSSSWDSFQGNNSIITKPFSFYRIPKVINSNTEILRYGATFIDSLYKYIKKDERGLSFSIWRYHPKYISESGNKVDVFFRFDFLIETNLEYVNQYCQTIDNELFKISLNNIKRLGDEVLPAFFKTIWLDIDGNVVDKNLVTSFLEKEYSKNKREDNSFDKNINSDLWEALNSLEFDFLDSWNDTCFYLRKKSEEELMKSDSIHQIKKFISNSRKIDQEHIVQRKARISSLENVFEKDAIIEKERMDIDIKIKEKIYEGCLSPKITLDSIGAVFLSKLMLS